MSREGDVLSDVHDALHRFDCSVSIVSIGACVSIGVGAHGGLKHDWIETGTQHKCYLPRLHDVDLVAMLSFGVDGNRCC